MPQTPVLWLCVPWTTPQGCCASRRAASDGEAVLFVGLCMGSLLSSLELAGQEGSFCH